MGGEIKSKFIVKGGEAYDIGCGNAFGGAGEEEKADDSKEKVIDVVDAFKYQETSFDKKGYTDYIKSYMKRVKGHLDTTKPERSAAFMKGATEMCKWIM